MLWLWLAGVVLRLPALGLPLLEPAAGLASQADFYAREQGFALHGHPLLPSCVLAIFARGPWTPTLCLRVVDAAVGALLAPLTATLFRRLGGSRRQALLAGLLTVVHPAVTLGAGGVTASTEGWTTVFFLAGAILGLSNTDGRRRVAALFGLAALASHPTGTLYGLLPLGLWIRREVSRAWLVCLPLAAALVLVLAPGTLPASGWLLGTLSAASLWGGGLVLLLLLPLLPGGATALARAGGGAGRLGQGWLALTAVHVTLLLLGSMSATPAAEASGSALVPVLSIAAVLGGARWGRWARGSRAAALGAALCASAYFGLGPLHLLVTPESDQPVALLAHRARAVDAARQVVGADGWITLDVLHGKHAEQASLQDLARSRAVWTARAPDEDAKRRGTRRLFRFPAEGYPPDRHVAVIAPADPPPTRIQTFGGVSIYQQEVIRRFGPYVVLRARRE